MTLHYTIQILYCCAVKPRALMCVAVRFDDHTYHFVYHVSLNMFIYGVLLCMVLFGVYSR